MTAMNDHDKLSALVAEWRADRPIITGGGYEEYRAAQNECAYELEAALAALSQGEGELDTGNLVSDPLYKALDDLYLRGWTDYHQQRKFDARGCNQWQAVLDLFRQFRDNPEAQQPEAVAWGAFRLSRGEYQAVASDENYILRVYGDCADFRIDPLYAHPTTPTHDGGGVTDEMVERALNAVLPEGSRPLGYYLLNGYGREHFFDTDRADVPRQVRRLMSAALTPATPQGGE